MLVNGTLLQKRYRIKRLIAQGGMGAVYEAEAVHLRNSAVAVKETFFSAGQQKLRDQFEREAATLARLRHIALPQVKDHFVEGDGQFLVMDFIAGDDLGKLLEQHLRDKAAPFGWRLIFEWADQLLDALNYIHSQYPPIIHRDIKPQNLKLTPRGELFLIDFGLAKEETTPTRPGGSLYAYTLSYAPPEQIKGTGTDVRSDIYSLGATLYHLVTGELPADARIRDEAITKHLMPDLLRPAHQVSPQTPFALAAVIARAMALNPEHRYPNAATMRQALLKAKHEIEAEIAERKRQEEEERKRQEERELIEQRRREEAARRLALQGEIKRRREELEQLERALQDDESTERLNALPLKEAQNATEKLAVEEFVQTKKVDNVVAFLNAAVITSRRWFLISGIVLVAALLIYLTMKLKGDRTSNMTTPPIQEVEKGGIYGKSFTEKIDDSIGLEMVYVPNGVFHMGSSESEPEREENEGPLHLVTVSSFYIGKYEVTQAQWLAVARLPQVFMPLNADPSSFGGSNKPVESVSWHQAREFCTRLSRLKGKNYRLPSEAEWEYATRAGSSNSYSFGNDESSLHEYAWYDSNSRDSINPRMGMKESKEEFYRRSNLATRRKTQVVGGRQPNAFRLFDMHGNVSEWCEDVWHNSYGGEHGNPPTDQHAWMTGGEQDKHVVRGGSWAHLGKYLRSASRFGVNANHGLNTIGFRVVVVPRNQ